MALRKKRSLKLHRLFLSLFLFFGLLAFSLFSVFRVRRVVVLNTFQTDPAKLVRLAQLHPFQKLPLRKNPIADKIAKHPWIRHVAVRAKLPDTLFLQIEERKPVYRLSSDERYLTDDGFLLKPNARLSLPVVDLPENLKTKKQLPDSLARALHRLATEDFGEHTLTSVTVLPSKHLHLYLDGQILIKWGRAEAMEKKLAVLKTLLQTLQQENREVVEVNLMSPDNPAVRTK